MRDSFNRQENFPSGFWRLLPQGMRRRWWWFRPFDWLARHWPVVRAPRGLLAIRMDGIGDMVLFRRSLDHYPEAFGVKQEEIIILGCESWHGITEQLFEDIRVITINEHRYARHLPYRVYVNFKVRQLAPAITVIDSYFRRALMSDSLAWVANAPRTTVAVPYINKNTRAEYTWYMSQGWEIINTGSYPTHEAVRHATFVSIVAGEELPAKPPMINWRDVLPPTGLSEPYVVLNPGSNEYGRRWPLANYVSLARWLQNTGLTVIFVGKVDPNATKDELELIRDHRDVIDLTGKSTLPELFDLIRGATLVISNDSGPAHVAIGMGTKTVVVIGGGHFGCFFPYPVDFQSEHARFIYERMECYHCFWRCHKRMDSKASFPCIEAVPISRVQAACRELLNLETSA